jgi:hypothetical protein
MKTTIVLGAIALAAVAFSVPSPSARLVGDYVEVRSCDVYTGSCVANSEMGLTGREGMMVWSIRDGTWKGTSLKGLSVIAVVRTDDTLGDLRYQPRSGPAVLIVDAKADSLQESALRDFARTAAGKLIKEVAAVKVSTIDVRTGQCTSGACATVKAGDLVEISTRCLGGKDHLCGNEDNFYPPLTQVNGAFSAFTELAAYRGPGLNSTWELTGKRSAYLATFSF